MPSGFQQIQEEEEEEEEAAPGVGGGVTPQPPPCPPRDPHPGPQRLRGRPQLPPGRVPHRGDQRPPEGAGGRVQRHVVPALGLRPSPPTLGNLWALSVAIFSVGGMGTALAGGCLGERLGRKGALLASNGLAVVGGALMGGAKLGPSYILIIIGRFLVGAYSGLASGLVPLYLGEVAPTRLRGALGTLHQLGIVVGILGAQVLGLPSLLGSGGAWPALLGAGLLPAALQLLLLPLCPESPRHLLARGRRGRARRALTRLAGAGSAEAELQEMEAELQGSPRRVGLLQLCRDPRYRQPLVVTVVLQLAQQLSGINAVFYYSTDIFEGAGLAQPALATIGTGVVNVVATVLSAVLVERVGRRVLALVGLLGMGGCALGLSLSMEWGGPAAPPLSALFALTLVALFALGPGPLPWLLGAELFGPGPRPPALAIAALANWATNGVVGLAFPAMQRALGPRVFLPFSLLLFLFGLVTFLRLPETRGCPFAPPRPPQKDATELQSLAGGGEA